jgi:hypothetical protein
MKTERSVFVDADAPATLPGRYCAQSKMLARKRSECAVS